MKYVVLPIIKYLLILPLESIGHSMTFILDLVINLSYSKALGHLKDTYDEYRVGLYSNMNRSLTFGEYIKLPMVL